MARLRTTPSIGARIVRRAICSSNTFKAACAEATWRTRRLGLRVARRDLGFRRLDLFRPAPACISSSRACSAAMPAWAVTSVASVWLIVAEACTMPATAWLMPARA